jgi:hemerythrin
MSTFIKEWYLTHILVEDKKFVALAKNAIPEEKFEEFIEPEIRSKLQK